MLVLIGGLPGVGKTTLARALAGRLGAAHLRIDSFEAALVRTGLVAGQADLAGQGYELALAAAETCLRAGTDVVVDAVFPVAASRAPFAELAERHGTPAHWVRLVCSDRAEHRRRVERRAADLPGHVVPTWAEADGRVVDEWTEPHVAVDTAGPEPLAEVEAALPTAASVVRAHVAAFDRGDVEALLAGFTPDATWRTGRSDAAGATELRELFSSAIAGLAPRLALRRLVHDGDTVAAELTETLTVDGVRSTVPICGWYRVAAGRIAQATIYREGSAHAGDIAGVGSSHPVGSAAPSGERVVP